MKKLTLIVVILLSIASISFAKCEKEISIDEIIEISAQSLSKMEIPDFSRIDPYDSFVWGVILMAWEQDQDHQFGKLSARVSYLSKGKVSLIRGDYEKFPCRIKGQCEYLILKGEKDKTILITYGPYSRPFSLCD